MFPCFDTPLQNISPKNTSNTLEILYFKQVKVERYLPSKKVKVAGVGVCCDPGGPRFRAVLRRWFECLHNSRRVRILMKKDNYHHSPFLDLIM